MIAIRDNNKLIVPSHNIITIVSTNESAANTLIKLSAGYDLICGSNT